MDESATPPPVAAQGSGVPSHRVSARPGEMVRCDIGEVTLAVDVRGEGPALLLVHGFPLDRSLWTHQVATLTGWRRIAPDLRGFGASDAPADGYSMATYAEDLVRLLDRLRVSTAVIAGLSMGGYIAFEILRRYRARVAGLILADTRADADSDEGRRGRDEMAALAASEGATALAGRLVPRLLGRSTQQTQPQLVRPLHETIARAPVAGIVGALRAMRDRPDSTALLASIDVPTLIVVGQEDELTPPELSKAMTAAIPSAAMTIIPAAGHLAPLEAPTAVSRVFGEFLEAVHRL